MVNRLLVLAGLRQFLHHRWQLFLALTGIALGVAVVLAVDLANQSAKASFEQSARELSGRATHRIASPLGEFPETIYSELMTAGRQAPMAPVVMGNVRLEGEAGRFRLVGVDVFAEGPFSRQLSEMALGRSELRQWLTDPDRISLGKGMADRLGLARGDALTVRRHGVEHRLRVHEVLPAAAGAGDDLLVADMATAQRVLGLLGRLTHIDVIADESSAAMLAMRLPDGVELSSIRDSLDGVQNLSATFDLNLTAMSLLALLVGMFLIFNAMNLSLLQRRLLLGRLRAAGVTPRELFRAVMLEAALLGLLGTAIGLALGLLIGQGLTALVAATVSELYYRVSVEAMAVQPFSLLKAVVLGLLATLAATLLPAWRAANTPALTVLSRAQLEQETRRRVLPGFLLGVGLALTGVLIALVIPGGVVAGFLGLFLAIIGAALMTPLVLVMIRAALNGLRLPLVPRMVVRSLERHLSRLGVAVAALAVALAAGVSVGTMVDSMRGGVTLWLNSLLNAPVYLGSEDFADGSPLPAALRADLLRMDEVSAVSLYRHRSVMLDGGRSSLVATRLAERNRSGFRLLDRDDDSAWRAFDAGAVMISEPLSSRLGIGAGDSFELPAPGGSIRMTVAATFRDYANEHGRIFMNRWLYIDHWQDESVNSMAVLPRQGVTARQLQDAVSVLLVGYPRVVLTPAQAILDESLRVFDRTFRVTEALRLLAMMVAFIGVFSALMALQLERRKEFAVLRALGLRRLQLGQLIVIESACLGLAAGLMALPLGLLMAWMLVESIQKRAFGWSMPFDVDPALLVQTVVIGVLAALLAAVYPAWQSSRQAPAAQLRED